MALGGSAGLQANVEQTRRIGEWSALQISGVHSRPITASQMRSTFLLSSTVLSLTWRPKKLFKGE
jgi:hypothetical protein